MKAIIYLLIITATVASCSHKYDTSSINREKYDQHKNDSSTILIVGHEECTDCLDAYILEGAIKVPADLVHYFGDTLSSPDIKLAGRFPFDLIDRKTCFLNRKRNLKSQENSLA